MAGPQRDQRDRQRQLQGQRQEADQGRSGHQEARRCPLQVNIDIVDSYSVLMMTTLPTMIAMIHKCGYGTESNYSSYPIRCIDMVPSYHPVVFQVPCKG